MKWTRTKKLHVSPSMAIATVALVFAMSGGAYAVSGHPLGTPSGRYAANVAKATPKKKPTLRGPRGPVGPRGPTGATGPQGPAGATGPQGSTGPKGENGAAGSDGTDGTNGANGTNGKNGTSATTKLFTGDEHGCEDGGVVIESASPETPVCNGKTGYTETLPPGKTETGTFGFEGNEEGNGFLEPLSFSIPLEAGAKVSAHFVHGGESPPAECKGGTPIHPAAEPGNLCVFQTGAGGVNTVESVTFAPPGGTTIGGPGVIMSVYVENTGLAIIYGSYAVTAPEA